LFVLHLEHVAASLSKRAEARVLLPCWDLKLGIKEKHIM